MLIVNHLQYLYTRILPNFAMIIHIYLSLISYYIFVTHFADLTVCTANGDGIRTCINR
jgi:hypothetical protein